MAQVTSPILLDSTGQTIVTKLESIKTAIENSGGGGGGSSVDVGYLGTASSTTSRYQKIGVNSINYEIDGTKYMEQNVTLSTSGTTTVTFTNAEITTASVVDLFADYTEAYYDSMTVSSGVITVVFPAQISARTIKVRVYIR